MTVSRPSVPEWLDRVVRRALQPTPGDRFPVGGRRLGCVGTTHGVRGAAAGLRRWALPAAPSRTWRGALVGAAAVALLAAGWLVWEGGQGPPTEIDHRLAVLPFDNLSPDPDYALLRAGTPRSGDAPSRRCAADSRDVEGGYGRVGRQVSGRGRGVARGLARAGRVRADRAGPPWYSGSS